MGNLVEHTSGIKEYRFDKQRMLNYLKEKGREDILKYSYQIGWNSERFLKKGDILYNVKLWDGLGYPVYIEEFGYAVPDPEGSYRGYKDAEDQALVFTVITDIEKVADRFGFKYRAYKDEFDGTLKVSWDKVAGKDYNVYVLNNFQLQLVLANNKPQLRVIYEKSGRAYNRGDRFEIILGNNQILGYSLTENPEKCYKGSVDFYLPLSEADFNTLREYSIVKVRLYKPKNTDQRLIGNNDLYQSDELSIILFKRYVNIFGKILQQKGFSWDEIKEAESIADLKASDPCYVYLMIDTANGYHKIGISNHPKYREGTLQSEKPTIELVCAKQYPSRVIATAIESALHSAFGEKRLRGEWFDLSDQDVSDIKLTLK